jgi:Ketol-acid reductoisomerase
MDDQVKLDPIRNETVAVIGYGIQGHAQANNLKDSGIRVIVGLRKEVRVGNRQRRMVITFRKLAKL